MFDDPRFNDHAYVTSQELKYRMQQGMLKEAAKAIIAVPGSVPGKGRQTMLRVTEVPKYNIRIYKAMFERIDIARSILQRMSELILSVDIDVRAPSSLLAIADDTKEALKKNIQFTTQWMRYKKFYTWLKEALQCTFWAGNSYSEKVFEIKGEKWAADRQEKPPGWRIHELKLLPPEEVRPIRNAHGDTLGYVQYPFQGTYTFLTPGKAQMYFEKGAVIFTPEEIIHFKLNPEPGQAYGTSILEAVKDILAIIVGMREDIGMIIKNYAAPTVLYRIGTDLIPASQPTVTQFRDNLVAQMKVSSNIVTSTMVSHEVVAPGKGVMNVEGYYKMMLATLFGSLGMPEILLGQGQETTEATAKMQLKAVSNFVKMMHQLIKDGVELEIFSYLCLEKHYYQLKPSDLDRIPELHFGEIETSEDKRIRWMDFFRFAGAARQEWRLAYGMKPEPDGDLTPEADLEFQKAIIEHTAKMGKKYAPPQATPAQAGVAGGKPKPTQKKSDRKAEHGKKSASTTTGAKGSK